MAIDIVSTVITTCGVRNTCKENYLKGLAQIVTGIALFVFANGNYFPEIAAMLGTSVWSGCATSALEDLIKQRKPFRAFLELTAGVFGEQLAVAATSPAMLPQILGAGGFYGGVAMALQSVTNVEPAAGQIDQGLNRCISVRTDRFDADLSPFAGSEH
jgi:hypothetical protein